MWHLNNRLICFSQITGHVSFFGATGTLCSWFLATSPLDFKARVGLFCFFVEANVMYIPKDPPLVLHMPTSWQLALQQVISTHASAEVGLGSDSNAQSLGQKMNALPLCQLYVNREVCNIYIWNQFKVFFNPFSFRVACWGFIFVLFFFLLFSSTNWFAKIFQVTNQVFYANRAHQNNLEFTCYFSGVFPYSENEGNLTLD